MRTKIHAFLQTKYKSYFFLRYLPCQILLWCVFFQKDSLLNREYSALFQTVYYCAVVPYSALFFSIAGLNKNWYHILAFVGEQIASYLSLFLPVFGILFFYCLSPDIFGGINANYTFQERFIPYWQVYLVYVAATLLGYGIRLLNDSFCKKIQ